MLMEIMTTAVAQIALYQQGVMVTPWWNTREDAFKQIDLELLEHQMRALLELIGDGAPLSILADEIGALQAGTDRAVLEFLNYVRAADLMNSVVTEPLLFYVLASIGLGVLAGSARAAGRFRAWWRLGAENDAIWRALPLKDKLYYEIGQKTLPVGQYAKYAHLSAVERGREIVREFGWFQALRPQGGGWILGAGSTLSTGPTPLVRWAVPRAAGAGAAAGGGYLLWRYAVGSDEE